MSIVVGGYVSWMLLHGRRLSWPPGTVLAIDGAPHSQAEFASYLGREPRFLFPEEADAALRRFADYLLWIRAVETACRDAGRSVSRSELIERFAAETGLGRNATDSDAERYYTQHRSEFVHPRLVKLAYFQVLLGGNPEQEHLQVESLRIQAQIARKPADFLQLLSRRVQSVESGEVGPVDCDNETELKRAGLPLDVAHAGCSLDVNTTSDPIQTSIGAFLVRKTSLIPGRDLPYRLANDEIRKTLTERHRRDAEQAALNRLRSEAKITIPESALAGLVEQVTSDTGERSAATGPPAVPGEDR
jgi:hypothetical protein